MIKTKLIKFLTMLIFIIFLFICGGIIYYKLYLKKAPIEYQQFNDKKIKDQINLQLKGVNLIEVRSKEKFILNRNIDEIQKSIDEGKLTYTDLTSFYLDRIKYLDQRKNGINAFIEVNPKAIETARKLDENPRPKENLLYGMPVTIKDNINTKDIPTSAGTYILKDFIPKEDASVVHQLKEHNAIILGKVNLSELANFMSFKMPDGYSSKGGQTQNPHHKLKFSPSGSSAGSAASIASNIGVISIGSETIGSIVSPANHQSVVGFKPTRSTVSGEGVFPLSPSQDTIGPITKSIKDAIIAYNAINIMNNKIDIHQLDIDHPKIKLGIPDNLNKVDKKKIISLLKKLNISYKEVELDISDMRSDKIIDAEFKFALREFADKYKLPFKTLDELIQFNKKDEITRMKYGQNFLETANKTQSKDNKLISTQIKLAQKRLNEIKEKNEVDAIISIGDEDIILSAIAGYPELSIPFGRNNKNKPNGLLLLGFDNSDAQILQMGYYLEQNTNKRILLQE